MAERDMLKDTSAPQHKFDANDELIGRIARQLRESTEVRRLVQLGVLRAFLMHAWPRDPVQALET